MIKLKVILVSIIFINIYTPKHEILSPYNLLNYLICEEENESLYVNFLDNFESYEIMNRKNLNYIEKENKIDLDEIFSERQRISIDEKLKGKQPLEIDLDSLSCKVDLNNTIMSLEKYVYSYSYPVVSNGKCGNIYGVVLVQEAFWENSTLKYKVYKKVQNLWELVYEELLAFS